MFTKNMQVPFEDAAALGRRRAKTGQKVHMAQRMAWELFTLPPHHPPRLRRWGKG